MRRLGLRQRNDTATLENSDSTGSFLNPDGTVGIRPQAQGTVSADSIIPRGTQSLRSRLGLVARHESFANSTLSGVAGQVLITSDNQDPDLLGLQLICDNAQPRGDIVFVHGLGGTAMRTWSWKRDVNYFWPIWLAGEQELSAFRIFSFGYNSNYKGVGTNLNILDFAKDLLFSLLTFSGGLKDNRDSVVAIGENPIYFVAHSMGGLVVKKAFNIGKHDKQYSELIAKVCGIVFLATPHRGAQYAKMLNKILFTAPIGAPPKAYVAELDAQSSSLQDINEQFRTGCENLNLASFFETKKTNIGVTKLLIVEKNSGILGYPQETSVPLNADHNSICKFESREDPNYISVKNLLKHWVTRLPNVQLQLTTIRRNNEIDIKKLNLILGIQDTYDFDLDLRHGKVLEGTCQWITTKADFLNWHESPTQTGTEIYWLVGLPATGKTSITRHVIDHLQFAGKKCFYHFFSSGDQLKRTGAYCLRSIAYQAALTNQDFREQLFNYVEKSGVQFNSPAQSLSIIWEKIFEGIMFKIKMENPMFMILDGIDESDSQTFLTSQLIKLQSLTPVKLFLTSRPMKIPSASLNVHSSLRTCFIHEEDTLEDIRAYIKIFVRDNLPDDPQFQENIINQVLAKASGSFLWVKLALESLQDNWHTREDIQNALTEVPKGMEPLYQRMLDTIKAQSPRQQEMAKRILTWAICCWRPLSIAELEVALQPEFQGFISLEHTIIQICGHFISVDDSKIAPVHATASSFLLNSTAKSPPFIDPCDGHEHLAITTLKLLSKDGWRLIFERINLSIVTTEPRWGLDQLQAIEKSYPLFSYAAYYWAYHVSKSSSRSQDLMSVLRKFLTKYALSWIEAIALSGNLRHLTRSAQYMKYYSKNRFPGSNFDASENLLSLRESLKDDSKILNSSANDFIRVVGKFGGNLVQSPSSIYRLVPPFCPRQSMIGMNYGQVDSNNLSLVGLQSESWDDRLASVSVGEGEIASKILATDAYFITLTSSSGAITVWHAETCEEARKICHNEYVSTMSLNRSGTRLATAGFLTYRIWDLSSGTELYCLAKSNEARTMTISFGPRDSDLIIGLDDCSITCYDLDTLSIQSRFVACDPLQDTQGCPRIMSISPDLQKVAIAWRGKPLTVWSMTQNTSPQRCRVSGSSDPLCAPELVKWHTNSNSVLILCLSSEIVEWNLFDGDQVVHGQHHGINAREMTMSTDGNFLLISDNVGTMTVWTFPRLQLIYRLVNGDEFIRDITFSPSGQRFYDIRDSTCNVWEPDALVRADDIDQKDTSNMAESSTAVEPVTSYDGSSVNKITSFAAGPDDAYYCCGKEDGTVTIHETINGEKVRKVYNHGVYCSVIMLAWSPSGRYIISSDDCGRVISKRLEIKPGGRWAVFPGLDIRVHEAVLQFLFSNDERLLLISTTTKDRVWDVKGKKEICVEKREPRQGGKWIADHINLEVLLWIEHEKVCSYKWTTLKCSDSECLSQITHDASRNMGGSIRSIAITKNKQNIVYEILPPHGISSPQLFILSTSSLSQFWKVDLSNQIKRMVGTFQNTIVFLDHDYWLCTWEIEARSDDIKRHFFLPKDWLNVSTLQMAILNEQGTFFCPKFGNVVIVRNGMRI